MASCHCFDLFPSRSLTGSKLLGSTKAIARDKASQLPIRLNQLCDGCAAVSQDILDAYTEWKSGTITSTSHPHFFGKSIRKGLPKRIKDKCHMCFMIQRGLNNATYFPMLYELLLGTGSSWESFRGLALKIRIRRRFSSKDSLVGNLRLFRTPEAAPPTLTISSIGLEFPYEHYLSRQGRKIWAAELISQWISECSANHSLCQLPSNISPPTRLIHILGPEEVHLVVSSQLTASERASAARYATVSHCWGSGRFLKLKSNNLDEFKRSIPFNRLIKKFQETIALCHSLKIEYVWIDTLCIIQEDFADWAREASRMAAVYQSGVINFMISGSSENDTCFPRMNMAELFPCQIRTRTNNGSSQQESFWLQPEVDLSNYFESDHKDFFPILKRGWVFQERYLSSCTVYLGGPRLIWDCRECLLSEETGLENHIGIFDWTHIPYDRKRQEEMIRPTYRDSHQSRLIRFRDWMAIVRGYTSADLTYATDRLAGIAGIASAFQQRLSEPYIAGMWEEQLRYGSLLWKPVSSADPLIRGSLLQGAPSWSWASVSLPVDVHLNPENEHCKASVSKVVKPFTQHVFGQVTEAILTIEAHVISPNCSKWLSDPFRTTSVTFSTLVCCLGRGETCRLSCSKNFMRLGKSSWVRHKQYAKRNYPSLFFLESAYCEYNSSSSGLVLVKAPKPEGAFIRVGCFESDYYSKKNTGGQEICLRDEPEIKSYQIV
ncbi:Heterokaryon incompatibility protein (HET) domain containing protein [Rhypophila decipiens]